jgi:RNA polymerase sigma-70 factor (ECF subfamily)
MHDANPTTNTGGHAVAVAPAQRPGSGHHTSDAVGPRSVRELDGAQLVKLQNQLVRIAMRSVRRPEVADDLVQKTYVAALENESSFESRSKLQTWLRTILHRKIADHFRRGGREQASAQATDGFPADLSRSTEPDFEARLDRRQAVRRLQEALPRLTEQERTAVVLCDFQDSDRREAAVRVGTTGPHLRVLLHRGRQKLRAASVENAAA